MRVCFLAFATSLLLSCVRFDAFGCSESDDCVLNGLGGQCEPTGYCSFPDPTCPSESRYSEHAPSNLARECVDPATNPTSTGTTGVSQSGSTQATESTQGESGSDSSGGITDCVDLDGDGAGIGADCELADCDDDNPNATDDCVYIGPLGNDGNAGTRDAPWRTFAYAVGALTPGSSLVVLDGRYVESDAGTLLVDCEESATVGTEAAPIFVRAENERQAVIDREGREHGIGISNCEYWRVRGLSVVSVDNAADDTGAWRVSVEVASSRQIELRRVFASHANRFYNEHLVFVGNSEDVLLEEVEAHDFFRSGFVAWRSNRVTFRRCYGNSHEAADLPACPDLPDCPDPNDSANTGITDCPKCSAGSPDRGDNTFYTEHSNNVLWENCVSEGSARGFAIYGGIGLDDTPAGDGHRVLQSVSIADDRSLDTSTNGDGITPRRLLLENFVSIDARSAGLDIIDPDAMTLRNVSIFGAAGPGIYFRNGDSANCTDGACSVEIDRALVEDVEGSGILFEEEPAEWSIGFSNVFGSGSSDYDYPSIDSDAFDDTDGNAHDNRSTAATELGVGPDECRVYVPEGSNMYDPFGDGTHIGGSMTDRLESGVSLGEAIWAMDGSFPCGADPLEPNQIAGEQCSDVALRTGLGASCPPPSPRGP